MTRSGKGARRAGVTVATRYPDDSPGGIERVAGRLAVEIGRRRPGTDLHRVVAFSGPGPVASLPLAGDIVAALRIAARSRTAPTVVIHGSEYAWAALLLRRISRQRVVVVWHGVRAEERTDSSCGAFRSLAEWLFFTAESRMQRLALSADETVAVSPQVRSDLERHYFPRPVRVITNGIDIGEAPGSPERLRNLVWVGTSAEKKGFAIALEAVEKARRLVPGLTLRVVGLDVAPGGLPGWVLWSGRLPPTAMGGVYAAADALLLPTRYEACSMAVLEALAFGRPVIGPESLAWQTGEAGELVGSRCPDDYADAVVRLASDDVAYRQRRDRAVPAAAAFTWEAAASAYVDLLDEVARV